MTGEDSTRETHGAWVFLHGDRALKVKKPVRFPFLDYSTLDRRYAACVREVEVNRELAPGTYLGVRAILDGHDGRFLGEYGADPDAIEYAVEMRRFDERRTMASLIAAELLGDEEVDRAAMRIAEFHRTATVCGSTGAAPFLDRIERDLADIAQADDGEFGAELAAARRFAASIARRFGAQLDARAARGLLRDGHGDLRAEHVVLEEPLIIVDRIEFDDAVRCCDVGSDLAFLTMDLEARGAAWAAERLVHSYRAAGGDPGGPALLAAFAWQRSLVRAKVALLRGDRPRARDHLELADRLAWRARMPAILLVGGPPASGKSTLAGELARRAQAPIVSSDVVRKELLGISLTERAGERSYSAPMTRRTYTELGVRAARALARSPAVIVDATLGNRDSRRIVLDALGDAGPAVMVECSAPPATLRERAERREADPRRVSDADADVAQRLAAAFEPAEEFADAGALCRLSTEGGVEQSLDALARWLDDQLPPEATTEPVP